MSRVFTKLLHDPVTWIRDNPPGSGLPQVPIPRELHRTLTALSPESKDGLITGIIFAAGVLQRDLNRINKRRKAERKRIHSTLQVSQENILERPYSQPSPPQVEDPALCTICLGTRIQQVTQCGHAFCKGCLSTWTEGSHTCPTCRQLVGKPIDLYL